MAVTIVVLSGEEPAQAGAPLSMTLDAPRIVIGRSEGCEVRLPDPTVSHRHASLRQRGGEYVILDENSQNGTFLDHVRLPPQTPRAVRSGERVRLGRVWIELRFEPAMVKGSTAAAAKELALALVARGLASQGEDPEPRVTIVEGPAVGATLTLADPARSYVVGRLPSSDLHIDHPTCARQHARLSRRGDALAVQDCGSPTGTFLDDQQLGTREVLWKPGQILAIGEAQLTLEYPAAEALAELERSPDERMPDGEVPEPPKRAAEEPAADTPAPEGTPTPAPADAMERAAERGAKKRAAADGGGWSTVDSAVVLLAIAVLALSVAGGFWLLGR
jgi:pSer/pThr/pTyr-binding forkhead associated (FHA) protein